MHIMCVRGVYVTDPAHNIIFGGKSPALFGSVLRGVSSLFFAFLFGSTFSVVSAFGSFSSTFFVFFSKVAVVRVWGSF